MKMQIKILFVLLLLSMNFSLVACGNSSPASPANKVDVLVKQNTPETKPAKGEGTTGIRIKVTAGSQVLTASLLDNATTRSLVSRFPLTVPMKNLYAREMVYRIPDPLPAEQAQRSGYEVGDLSYWTPGHSLVIFYKQNGEIIDNLQKIGRFDSMLDFLQNVEAADVRFELLKE